MAKAATLSRQKGWITRRKEIIASRGNKCEWCSSTETLQINHVWKFAELEQLIKAKMDNSQIRQALNERYKALREEDVQVLCKRCHYRYHKGIDICPQCKGYKKMRNGICFKCWSQTAEGIDYIICKEQGHRTFEFHEDDD